MSPAITAYISALMFGLMITLGGIFFLYRFKNIYGYKFGIAVFLGSFIWILSHYFELLTLSENIKLWFYMTKYAGITSLPLSFFLLLLCYTGYSQWLNIKKIMLLGLVPAATLLLVFTNHYHGLVWTGISFNHIGILTYIDFTYGIWFWVWVSYCGLLTLTGLIMLAKLLTAKQKVFRGNAIILIAALTFPALFSLLDIFTLFNRFDLKLTPLGLILGSAVLLYGFVRLKIGNFIPMSLDPDLENNQDMVITIDKNDRIAYANQLALKGFDSGNPLGKTLPEIWPGWTEIRTRVSSGFEIIDSVALPNTPGIFSLSINPFMDIDQNIVGKVLIFNDVTEQRLAEERYKSIFKNSLDGIFRVDMDGNYIEVNQSMLNIFNCSSKQELPLINISQNLKSESLDNHRQEFQFITKDGNPIWVEASIWSVQGKDGHTYFEGIVRDINNRKLAEKKIKYLSFHDSLTGLYNRYFFEEELKRLDTGRMLPLSIIIGDVNGLKLINDTFGHSHGDRLLCKIARILKYCFRKEDIVARWGGDEFIAILPNTSKEDAQKVIERIKQRCDQESEKRLTLSISLGCACKQLAPTDLKTLIKEAEDQMYRHKLVETKSARSRMISSLEKALEERDYETEEHMQRMKRLARETGRCLGLADSSLDELSLLATLHDIGKIAIADHIILKPDKLSLKEWDIIKKHPEIGYRIASQSPELNIIAEAILCHHENWDGSGYPRGLKGVQIPLLSRIISIVDTFDAMTNDRPYRKALGFKEALEEIKMCSGTQFDPEIVAVFISLFEKDGIITQI